MALDNLSPHAGMKYRADIDGLRAVAVLLVVFFHLETRVYGGFIGVDVFFVISGYLISAVIMTDIDSGRFSIASFYERRVRRIFPALLVMMAVTTVLAYRLLIPSEVEEFARSQLAALFSGSNFFFWFKSGYFDDPSATKPLLHTWSLGVEEQFYIFFPPLLLLLRRYCTPHWTKAVLYGCALASLVAAALVVPRNPTAAFFFAPLRAWELLVGTILSQRYLPPIRGRVARNVASTTGLLMILLAAWKFTERTPFPGLAALLPCVGAGLVVAAGETGGSVVASLLAWRPVVFVGLISYSLYLWHWPLLVFQRTSSMLFPNAELSILDKVIYMAIALVVATLSWALVERPFRTGRLRPGRVTLWYEAGFAMLLLTVVSAVLLESHGLPGRFPADAQQTAVYSTYDRRISFREGSCFLVGYSHFSDFHPEQCLAQTPGRRSILIAGDSHAAQLYPGFVAEFPDADILQANAANCHGFAEPAENSVGNCRRLNAYLYDDFLAHHRVDLLVLAARWSVDDLAGLGETIEFVRARGIPMVVVGPNIEYDLSLPRLMATALRDGRIGKVPAHQSLDERQLDDRMSLMAQTVWHVPYISIYRDLCAPACPLYAAPNVPLLFDTNHFTREGSVLLAKAIRARHQVQ